MPTAPEVVAHLYRRAGFGATVGQIDALSQLELPVLVDRLLDRSGNPFAAPPAALSDPSAGGWDRWAACVMAWLDRMATTPTPLVEKLALFWHGHFVSSLDKVGDMGMMWAQIARYRTFGMGSFRTLAHAMAIEPAMLRYLDGASSVAGAPNQNFARELFELFLLGVGNYSEDDVGAAARAWTGHTLDDQSGGYIFRTDHHDAGLKTLFGTTASFDGPGVIDAVLDHPAKSRVCARFIVGKLWAFFAHPEPPAAVVDALATVLIDHDFELTPMLRALFLRPEFYAPKALDGLVRSPIEWCVALIRATGLPASETHPEWSLAAMGQAPFAPPSVAGWRGNQAWISSAAAQARADHVSYICWKAQGAGLLADGVELPAREAVLRALATFGVDRPSPTTVDALETWLVAQRTVPWSGWFQQRGLIVLVGLCPEMQLA